MQNKEPLIPQNQSKYFKFVKHKKHYSVDIEFDYFSKINYQNLFLIIKSYVNNDAHLLLNVFIIASDEQTIEKKFNMNIFRTVKIEKLKKIKYFEFKDWFDSIKEDDYEYVKTLKYYGFRFTFSRISEIWSKDEIYPIYPWDKQFKNMYIKNNINFKKWLFIKNKYLYKKWIIDNRKSQTK